MCVQLMSRNEVEAPEVFESDPECQCVLELCLACDLSEVGPCSACNGRGWVAFDRPQ